MSYAKRKDHLNIGDQFAIGQGYRKWIKCIKNKDLVPQNILFINTLSFGKKFNKKNPFINISKSFQTFLDPIFTPKSFDRDELNY